MVRVIVLTLLVVTGCGDDAPQNVDADVSDTPPDVPFDNGSCGDQLRFTGELVDWDAEQSFCGVFEARFEVSGGGAMDTTAPNGRFDMCVPQQPITVVDVAPSADPSQCAVVGGTYVLPALAVVDRSVLLAGVTWSGRLFTMNRKTVDPGRAQVFVNVAGTSRAVSIAANHGPSEAVVGGTWMAGDTGAAVFFPDVDPAGGSTTLSVAGGAIGTGSIPLVAGKITLVNVLAN